MSYSKLGIINLALGKLGNSRIVASLTEDTAERIAATTVWDYVVDEVLGKRPWYFAKTRTRLHRVNTIPAFGFEFAYVMPSDFIRLINPKPDYPSIYPSSSDGSVYQFSIESIMMPDGLEKVTNGTFTGAATGWTLGTGWTYGSNKVTKATGAVNTLSQIAASMVSVPVIDEVYLVEFDVADIGGGSLVPSIGAAIGTPVSEDGEDTQQYIQAIDATGIVFTPSYPDLVVSIDNVSVFKCLDKLALLIDYEDSEGYPLYMGYVRRIIDVTRWSPSFVSTFAFRLAAEMALKLTEGMTKYSGMMGLYNKELAVSDGISQSMGSLEGEVGLDTWENAGR